MPIPKYQTIMLPLLQLAGDGEEHFLRDAIDELANRFKLTAAEHEELLPSGRQATFDNRVGWARTYLAKAGLLESTRRGYFKITPQGEKTLGEDLERIDGKYLRQFKSFRKFRTRGPRSTSKDGVDDNGADDDVGQTPEESLEAAYQGIRADLAAELLSLVHEMSPTFFERLVVELLVRMGYGGTLKDAGQAIGQSGDGGIDGIIKEDRLGLDIVYVQAKRWKPGTSIGRPEIQKFAGALQGRRARKGVFMSTAKYTKGAREYVSMIDSKIVLIDGPSMAELMIDYNVGVSTVATYEHKKLDTDYFTDS